MMTNVSNGIFVGGNFDGNVYLDEYANSYLNLVDVILHSGGRKSPRGQNISYWQNCLFQVKFPGSVFSTPSRDYKFDYLNKELELYFSRKFIS